MLEIFDGACDIFDGAAVIAIALQEQHIHLALAGPLYIGAYGVIRILFGKMTIKHHGDPVYRQPVSYTHLIVNVHRKRRVTPPPSFYKPKRHFAYAAWRLSLIHI